MGESGSSVTDIAVALLAEGVGRNKAPFISYLVHPVALLAEGVGRNYAHSWPRAAPTVALLAEGVGRNWIWKQSGGKR